MSKKTRQGVIDLNQIPSKSKGKKIELPPVEPCYHKESSCYEKPDKSIWCKDCGKWVAEYWEDDNPMPNSSRDEYSDIDPTDYSV
ncbi:hypothetical protein [Flavobacterium sp.]|uniref:hypothetical protein n=1 Tax=Flavobacterium sp. TaxID=239 RepID=UPI0032663A41